MYDEVRAEVYDDCIKFYDTTTGQLLAIGHSRVTFTVDKYGFKHATCDQKRAIRDMFDLLKANIVKPEA